MATTWYIAAEDALSLAVAELIVKSVSKKAEIMRLGKMGGNGELRKNIGSYNRLGQSFPVLILTDLDNVTCAPILRQDWFQKLTFIGEKLIFRVAIREVESWLLADNINIAAFLHAPATEIPLTPDTILDPKQTLLRLSKRYAPRDLKSDLVQEKDGGLRVGLGYNNQLIHFVKQHWDLKKAASNSDSLARAYRQASKVESHLK